MSKRRRIAPAVRPDEALSSREYRAEHPETTDDDCGYPTTDPVKMRAAWEGIMRLPEFRALNESERADILYAMWDMSSDADTPEQDWPWPNLPGDP